MILGHIDISSILSNLYFNSASSGLKRRSVALGSVERSLQVFEKIPNIEEMDALLEEVTA